MLTPCCRQAEHSHSNRYVIIYAARLREEFVRLLEPPGVAIRLLYEAERPEYKVRIAGLPCTALSWTCSVCGGTRAPYR
eukprot:COSAG04_NODE_640_length_11672_cov_32.635358_13_plen_79_part_00